MRMVALAQAQLQDVIRNPLLVLFAALLPAMGIMMRLVMPESARPLLVVMLSVMAPYFVGWNVAGITLAEEKEKRRLEALFLTPVRPWQVVMVKGALALAGTLVMGAVMLAVGGKVPVRPGIWFLAYLLLTLFAVGAGTLLGLLFKDMRSMSIGGTPVQILLLFATTLPWALARPRAVGGPGLAAHAAGGRPDAGGVLRRGGAGPPARTGDAGLRRRSLAGQREPGAPALLPGAVTKGGASVRKLTAALLALLLLAGCAPGDGPAGGEIRRRALTIALDETWTAAAELTYPAGGDGPWPAVILFHGSGPMDMDATNVDAGGRVVSANFRLLAERLARSGYVVLRFHKRGVRRPGDYDLEQAYRATTNQLIADAGRVIAAAREQPEVDGGRIYLYGWSQGAQVAAHAALADRGVAGVILQGPPTGGWAETLRYQHLELGLRLLAEVDADGDGKLSAREWMDVPPGPAALDGQLLRLGAGLHALGVEDAGRHRPGRRRAHRPGGGAAAGHSSAYRQSRREPHDGSRQRAG